jgi:hypothetical protein
MKKVKPKKDRIEGRDLMHLISACRCKNIIKANVVMAEIEKYKYISEVDNRTVLFLREKLDEREFNQIVKRYVHNC